MIDLFDLLTRPERCHPQFTALRDSQAHAGARALINSTYNEMGDPNGRFVRDFQTHGFHGRLFELSCFRYLLAAGFAIDERHERPDFIASRDRRSVAIEVTTANPPSDTDPDISVMRMQELTDEEVHARAEGTFPTRLMASLKKKLRHRYHELPQVAGKPIVLMIAPCFEPAPGVYVDESLLPALYPLDPSGVGTTFFEWDGAEAISAVVYSNSFTVSKFWRLGAFDYLANECVALRQGMGLFEGERSVMEFRHMIGHEATPRETWSEGVTLYFNPFAQVPLPEDLLPASSKFVLQDDELVRKINGFHPLASFMTVEPKS